MISNIKIKNFRNIRDADVDFNNINIITGKNSCGKSNLLDLIKTFPSAWDENVYDKFDGNIVSEGAGISESAIKLSINIDTKLLAEVEINNEMFLYGLKTSNIVLNKTILKNGDLKSNTLKVNNSKFLKRQEAEAETKINIKPKDLSTFLAKADKVLMICNNESKEFNIDSLSKDNILNIKRTNDDDAIYKNLIKRKLPKSDLPILSNSVKEFENLKKIFIDSFNIRNIEETVERIKSKKKNISHFRDFNDSNLYYLLADIQSDDKIFDEYTKNIKQYTNNIITSFSINVSGKGTRQGHFNVESPNGSKLFSSLSMGTLILLYVITLNSWLSLNSEKQIFKAPTYLIFDEIDSYLHPNLISSFTEMLKLISKKSQIFFVSHSPLFLDEFEKKDIYILQDSEKNKSNIMNYKDVMSQLPPEIQEEFKNSQPSELFSEGYIDDFIPLK